MRAYETLLLYVNVKQPKILELPCTRHVRAGTGDTVA